VDPHEKAAGWIQVKHLVETGALAAGTTLTPGNTDFAGHRAVVRADGLIEIDGKTFDTPSGAGRHVKGSVVNGWSFWRLADGRKLRDVRAAYAGADGDDAAARFDWSGLHTLLELLPAGHWTTYGSLADAVGTSPQPLGQHVRSCQQCANAHRILKQGGRVEKDFKWTDPDDQRDPLKMLREEGTIVDGAASPARELSSDDLQALIEQ
jgi:alkylated DNA nucleotide flippase Atl1